MPELPEVETTARGLREVLPGRTILAVEHLDWSNVHPLNEREHLRAAIPGRSIVAVERRGKYLILRLDPDGCLLLHRKMSGNLLALPAGEPAARHTHFGLSLSGDLALHFVDPRKFGRVYFFEQEADGTRFLDARLGIEPLEELTPARLLTLLAGRRGRVKSLLLDQRFIAGIGNLYADESLWRAGVHPERIAQELSKREVARLAVAIVEVLNGAIARRGTSLSDYLDASGEPGENQRYLDVYGRAGQPCHRCGVTIRRMVVGLRGTWICPRCQRLPRRGSGGR